MEENVIFIYVRLKTLMLYQPVQSQHEVNSIKFIFINFRH